MLGLTERVFDQLTPAKRVLVAIGASVPFFLLTLLGDGWVLAQHGTGGVVRVDVVEALQGLLVVCTLLCLGTAVRLWPQRHETNDVEGATLLVCLSIGVAYTAIAILAGTFTAPTCLVLPGVLVIGLLLFTLRPMVIAFLVCAGLIAGHDLCVQLGGWSYAPALMPRIFEGNAPVWGYAVWRNAVLIADAAVLLPLILLLFGRLERMHVRLVRLSQTDGLTGLANRRRFMEALHAEVARWQRSRLPVCVVLLDIDHFKRVNDDRGHLVGDAVLREVASMMMGSVRAPTDLPTRLGGEEFALILPDTPEDVALAVCERLREQVASHPFQGDVQAPVGAASAATGTASSKPVRITVSIGLAEVRGGDVAEVLRGADQALYQAKASGRDRVCVAPRGGWAA